MFDKLEKIENVEIPKYKFKSLKEIRDYTSFNKSQYKFIIIDASSISIVPYLYYEEVFSKDGYNITPFYNTLETITDFKRTFKNSHIIVPFDNGLNYNIKSKNESYKGNRNYIKYRNVYSKNALRNTYLYNIQFINKLLLSTGNLADITEGEADFKIGFYVKKLIEEKNYKRNEILVVSGDKDLLITSDYVDVMYLRRNKTTKDIQNKRTWYYINKDTQLFVLQELFKSNVITNGYLILLYKALAGDKSDNISGLMTEKKAQNLLQYMIKEGIELLPENVLTMVFEKQNIKDVNLRQSLTKRFYVNINTVNLFNTKSFSKDTYDTMQTMLNVYLDYINKDNSINRKKIEGIFIELGLRDKERINKYTNTLIKYFSNK